MGKRPALGRGLAALLGEQADRLEATEAREQSGSAAGAVEAGHTTERSEAVVDLPVADIRPNPRQPRRSFEPVALEELAGSISEVGVVQPVIVRPVEGGYELIAGERRWRAAQKAGFTVVPAIVRRASDIESLELALIENVVRQELNPLDEAFALKVLLDDLGVTQESLAARVGRSRSALANKVRLLDLPTPIQDLLLQGAITEGHGRALLGVADRGRQLQLARRAARRGLSVRQVEEEVRRLDKRSATSAGTDATAGTDASWLDEETLDGLRDAFFSALGVMPRVKAQGRGGVVELPFRDPAELRRIQDRLQA